MKKIDLVYMWVNDRDKNWQREKNHWLQEIKNETRVCDDSITDARWRDNDELKFALRSAEKFAPWINHIFIVTGFGQVPEWLNTKHPKITVVPQEDIMPKDSMPTFNSVAIEMCIMNIPNLSEHFLLSNDDMFFNRHIDPSFFYDNRGRAIVWYTQNKKIGRVGFGMEMVESDYRKTILMAAYKIYKLFGKKFYKLAPAHNIDPYIKSSMLQCRNHPMLTRDFDAQIRNKFRTNWELQRWIFNLYDVVHNRAVLRKRRFFKKGRHFIYNLVNYRSCKNSPLYCENAEQAMKHTTPTLFCINDTVNVTDAVRKQNWEFLNKKFPEKSSFEL